MVPVLSETPGPWVSSTGGSWRRSLAAHPPLPGDEVDVVSQRSVVSGQLLRRRVLPGLLGLGGVRLGQCAQAHEQGQGERQAEQPQSLAPQHLRAPKVQGKGSGV